MNRLVVQGTAPTAAPDLAAQLAHAPAGHFDELFGHAWPPAAEALGHVQGSGAQLAPHWARFFSSLDAQALRTLGERQARLRRHIHDSGVTYNVHADDAQQPPPRPWPVDLFPLLIDAQDWRYIERGILQRVRLLNAVLLDIYGPQRLLRQGLIAPALVQGHPDYLHPMHGVCPPGGTHLHIVAFDLARDATGNWWVVSQRTQAPSGLGYLLGNRQAVPAQFPGAFERMRVRRLGDAYRALIDSLKAMAPCDDGDAHIALLTPGPRNETYFEHAYLARYLGVTLVEGSDLTVRGEKLYLKTLHGLHRVHALIKRVDDSFVDPLEMRADSRLGVPGLLQAIRAGHVLVANQPGAGFLESSALLGFLPAVAQALLGEELLLPALHTWWCGEPAAMADALPRLGQCVIKPTYPWSLSRGTFNAGVGPYLDAAQLADWAERIRRNPDEHTVQAFLPASHLPTWNAQATPPAIAPRAAILRVFALSNGVDAWQVLPGGMTRLAGAEAGLASMQQGGSSADCWVLGEESASDATATEHSALAPLLSAHAAHTAAPIAPQRTRLVTSRAAENLFWLGRYCERAENAAQLARITLQALHGEEEPSWAMLTWLGQMAESTGLAAPGTATPQRGQFERLLIANLCRLDDGAAATAPSVGFNLRALRHAGSALRERLSPEHWNFIKAAEDHFLAAAAPLARHADTGAAASADAVRALEQLSKNLAAITGAQYDRMWRDDGWRLMSAGRKIERLGFLANALSRGFYTNAVHDAAGFGVVLNLFDASISYHARYQRSRDIAALIEHVVLNLENPRSLGSVAQTLNERLAQLHSRESANLPDLSRRLQNPARQTLQTLCAIDSTTGDFYRLQALLAHCLDESAALSDEIGLRHFRHTGDARRSVGA
ncbi:MAG: circularly permuted type 2 ATP-grasp protein [Burkholderiaceae bacterium]|jgi:uncharacterized circularly permuted ATP-grasp superfamily protein/uncharacterized alpha-E superfamily protein|nr:circularly permuted type 2 ATP-grasp protein [Burkholderiaceae bacterium]